MFYPLDIYGAAALVLGFAVFVGACLVVSLCKRPVVIAAYLPFVLIPLLIGIQGCVARYDDFYYMLSQGDKIHTLSVLASPQSDALHALYSGLLATWPSLLVIAIGLFVRTLQTRERPQEMSTLAAERHSKE